MIRSDHSTNTSLLLLIAGAKGAVASTLAVALAAMQSDEASVLPNLTTGNMFDSLGPLSSTRLAGWDTSDHSLTESIKMQGVLPDSVWQPHAEFLDRIPVCQAPGAEMEFRSQVEQLIQDITIFRSRHEGMRPVLINLLPAAAPFDLGDCRSLSDIFERADATVLSDLAYTLAAVFSGVPVVNFTPNTVELTPVLNEAVKRGVPIAGRDGKTGQTYFKVVLASALKARNLMVDGWYSLNILGNADGANLMDPNRASGKLRNKTNLLNDILDYTVGENYGMPAHKVRIDYYPPRGDAKEAWDVIDFKGLFGLPMSLRVNLQARDSILAAPLVFDLARWVAILQMAGRSGPVPQLAFYFKIAVGESPPQTFQDQVAGLLSLERECEENLRR
ncbi:MAG: inositol-3-phosphate synthase [Desulfobacterales bacterium]|jgi:myo-inositol-1-phosphate synthase